MKFIYSEGDKLEGQLSYVHEERSFDFEPQDKEYAPANHGESAALTAASTLQIEFLVENGRLLYVWGYLPKECWQLHDDDFQLGPVLPGQVFAEGIEDLRAGIGYRSTLDESPVLYYEKAGRLVIGKADKAERLIEVAQDIVIGLKDDQLMCVVLRPQIFDITTRYLIADKVKPGHYVASEFDTDLNALLWKFEYIDVANQEFQIWEYPSGKIYDVMPDRTVADKDYCGTPDPKVWLPKLKHVDTNVDLVEKEYARLKKHLQSARNTLVRKLLGFIRKR